jgi:cell division protein FtsI (penicillin-binding protein 3)
MSTSVPPSNRHRMRQRSGMRGRQLPPNRADRTSPFGKWTTGARRSPENINSRRGIRAQAKPTVRPSRFRLILVWAILLISSLGLALNLFRLQVIQAQALQERAQEQQVIQMRPFMPRRPIVDRQGNLLAIDQPVSTLYAHPIMFKQSQESIADALAPLLGLTAADLLKQFSQRESGIPINQTIPEEVAQKIKRLGIDGLELVERQQRLYPRQELFANVVGYVNDDREGQIGVESSHQQQLERSIEMINLRRTGDGSVMPDGLPNELLHPDDLRLQLTLDSRLQQVARSALIRQIEHYGAQRGTVLVMDVQDGSLLALATEPSFDPNRYYESDLDRLNNWAVSSLYEPGSTFKPINVAIALETDAVTPNDSVSDEGQIIVAGWPIENSDFNEKGGRGSLTIPEVLKYSSNVGMVHIMERLDPKVYYRWLERLGLGKSIGVDLPSEATGQMKPYEQFIGSVIEPATTAFGQGFSLTPIQLLQLHGTLANDGKMVTPHVTRGLVDASGQLEWEPDLPQPRSIFSPQTTRAVLEMMETAVQEGTGKPARVPGYRIAGKTGTAQKASPDGGYYNFARITSFVGTFPVAEPRYTVLVVIDEPQGEDAYGSTVAAPIAKSVIEALIAIEQIPPTEPISPDSSSNEDETDPSLDVIEPDSSDDFYYSPEEAYSEEVYPEEAYSEEYYSEDTYLEPELPDDTELTDSEFEEF